MSTTEEHLTRGQHFDLAVASPEALGELADASRRLLDASVRTEVDDARLAEATALVRRADELLRGDLRDGPPMSDMRAEGRRAMQFRYNPVVGSANPIAPPVDFEVRDGEVHATVTLGQVYEGPPGYVHGGILSLLLDQSLGYAGVVAGRGGMTRSLHVTYRRPTPLDTPLEIWSAFDTVEDRDIINRGTITANGNVTVEAHGIFRMLSREQGKAYFAKQLTNPAE